MQRENYSSLDEPARIPSSYSTMEKSNIHMDTQTQSRRTNSDAGVELRVPAVSSKQIIIPPKGLMDALKSYVEIQKGEANTNTKKINLEIQGTSTSSLLEPPLDERLRVAQTMTNSRMKRQIEQTEKITKEFKKKRLVGKSRAQRFQDEMNFFKQTESYIEIKPFLEQLNILNNPNYLSRVSHISREIENAKSKYQHLLYLQQQQSQQTECQKDNPLSIKLKQAIKSVKNNGKDQVIRKDKSFIDNILQQAGMCDSQIFKKDGENNEDFKLQLIDCPKQKSLRNKQQEMAERKKKLFQEPSDNQSRFFENMKEYLSKASNEITFKQEMVDEDLYFRQITVAQEKILALQQEQACQFVGKAASKPITTLFFNNSQNIYLKSIDSQNDYLENYRIKADAVRRALEIVSTEIYNKKWASGKAKFQYRRQQEKNTYLALRRSQLSQIEANKNHKTFDQSDTNLPTNDRLLTTFENEAENRVKQIQVESEDQSKWLKNLKEKTNYLRKSIEDIVITNFSLPSENENRKTTESIKQQNQSSPSTLLKPVKQQTSVYEETVVQKSLVFPPLQQAENVHSLNRPQFNKQFDNSFNMNIINKKLPSNTKQSFGGVFTPESSIFLNGARTNSTKSNHYHISEANKFSRGENRIQKSQTEISDTFVNDVSSRGSIVSNEDFHIQRRLKKVDNIHPNSKILRIIEDIDAIQSKTSLKSQLIYLEKSVAFEMLNLQKIEPIQSLRGNDTSILPSNYYQGSKITFPQRMNKIQ